MYAIQRDLARDDPLANVMDAVEAVLPADAERLPEGLVRTIITRIAEEWMKLYQAKASDQKHNGGGKK